jgi:hypothetical protein
VLKLLEKRPEDRYASASAVRAEVVKLKKKLAVPTSLRGEPEPPPPHEGAGDTALEPPSLDPRAAAPAPDTQPVPEAGDQTLPRGAKARPYRLDDEDGTEDTLPSGTRAGAAATQKDDEVEDTLPRGTRAGAATTQEDDEVEDTLPSVRDPKAGIKTAEVRRVARSSVKPAPAPPPKSAMSPAVWVVVTLVLVGLVVLTLKAIGLP